MARNRKRELFAVSFAVSLNIESISLGVHLSSRSSLCPALCLCASPSQPIALVRLSVCPSFDPLLCRFFLSLCLAGRVHVHVNQSINAKISNPVLSPPLSFLPLALALAACLITFAPGLSPSMSHRVQH